MFANVARTAAGRRGFAPGGRAARVTHALLVIAVAVVPPGVHTICSSCPLPDGPHACCAGLTVETAEKNCPPSPGGCRCWLTARDGAGGAPVPRPAAAGAAFPVPAAILAALAIPTTEAVVPDAATFAPSRPLRVLLGVWRN